MAATVHRKWENVDYTIAGTASRADILYIVVDAADEIEAKAAASLTDATFDGIPRRRSRIVERLGDSKWKLLVTYEPYGGNLPEDTFTFNTGGGTQRITQAIATRNSYAEAPLVAPNMQGAIGFDGKRVQGVDIGVPVFNFTETYTKAAGDVDQAYKIAVSDLGWRYNNAAFRGWPTGEVLFTAAAGRQQGGTSADWQITYVFARSPNLSGLTIGTITAIAKLGWDYLWTLYEDSEDESVLIKTPRAVYVDQVYYSGNFALLEI